MPYPIPLHLDFYCFLKFDHEINYRDFVSIFVHFYRSLDSINQVVIFSWLVICFSYLILGPHNNKFFFSNLPYYYSSVNFYWWKNLLRCCTGVRSVFSGNIMFSLITIYPWTQYTCVGLFCVIFGRPIFGNVQHFSIFLLFWSKHDTRAHFVFFHSAILLLVCI